MEFNGSHSKQDKGKEERKDFWTYLEDNRREVAKWPSWMRGEIVHSSEGVKSKEEEASEDNSGTQSKDIS